MITRRSNTSQWSLVAETATATASWIRRALLLVILTVTSSALAQNQPNHYFQSADMPPGSIGRAQLMRGGPLPGHFQAVEIQAPEGASVVLAADGLFEPPQPAPLRAGLLVGNVYRLKVTDIPFHPGMEVFPSVEIINRLYTPVGSETRFPIPIQLTQEELELALRGQFVIRVIYLEDPQSALPRPEDPQHQRYFEVGPGQDPLRVADGLGRPMAILRLGSRVPDLDPETGRFVFQSPPWLRLPEIVSLDEGPQPADPEADVPPGGVLPQSPEAGDRQATTGPEGTVPRHAVQRSAAGVGGIR